MRNYSLKVLLFSTPFIIFFMVFIVTDVFKVFREYENYYEDNFVELNREYICFQTYKKYKIQEKFNSYIFGSSLSLSFKCEDWKQYLLDQDKCFHFDGHGAGIFEIRNALQYINNNEGHVDNALVIVDKTALMRTEGRKGHLYISPPGLSDVSKFKFYREFFSAALDWPFLIAYFDYSIFKKHRLYMSNIIKDSKYPDIVNPINCDVLLGKEKHIIIDSLDYFSQAIKNGLFSNAIQDDTIEYSVTDNEILLLEEIRKLFESHQTKYKIIIAPVTDQIELNKSQVEVLNKIFGKENVFDFSGQNNFTEHIHNFYDAVHSRPHIAAQILELVYLQSN